MSQNDWNLTQIDPTRKVTNVLCVRRIRSQVSSLAPIQEMTQSHTKQRIKEYEWNATHLQQNVSEFSQKLVLSHIKYSSHLRTVHLKSKLLKANFFPLSYWFLFVDLNGPKFMIKRTYLWVTFSRCLDILLTSAHLINYINFLWEDNGITTLNSFLH